jgi:hypothetical protein
MPNGNGIDLEPGIWERDFKDIWPKLEQAWRNVPAPAAVPGWLCPACGRGNSPYTSTCPCIPIPMVVTC